MHGQRIRSRLRRTAVVVGLLALACAGVVTTAAPSSIASAGAATGKHIVRSPRTGVTNFTSTNWDGYFTTAANHGTDFNAVSAQWTEPAVTCDSNESWAGFWVGLDGWWNDSVEQGGTEAHCINGTPFYNVWWEMFPFNDIQSGFAIRPGDKMRASVTFTPSTGLFRIVVTDTTLNQTLTKSIACQSGQQCDRSSADVISEDIGGGTDTDGLFFLPDYNTASYASASVTDVNGHTGPLSDSAWQLGHVTEVSSQGLTKQTTSGLGVGGASFTTTWLHE